MPIFSIFLTFVLSDGVRHPWNLNGYSLLGVCRRCHVAFVDFGKLAFLQQAQPVDFGRVHKASAQLVGRATAVFVPHFPIVKIGVTESPPQNNSVVFDYAKN